MSPKEKKMAQPLTTTVEMLRASNICKATYQRPVDRNRVKRIVKNFNPYRAKNIQVSFRDGKYWVWDGQHTLEAFKEYYKNPDVTVRCTVAYGLTYEEEARLFAEQDVDVAKVRFIDKLRSLHESGDADVDGCKAAVEMAGGIFDFSDNKKPYRVSCGSKIFKIYKDRGSAYVVKLIKTLVEIWNGEPDSLGTAIIGGMDIFLRTYDGKIDYADLKSKLSKTTPRRIIAIGKDFVGTGDKRFAKAIVREYNKSRRSKKLDESLVD